MKRYRFRYPIGLMARILEVSRSGYYAWLKAVPSQRAIRHRGLKPLIEEVHIQSRKTYGSRRITAELQEQGHEVGRDQVSRLRKEMGLFCVQKKKFKATTNSTQSESWIRC